VSEIGALRHVVHHVLPLAFALESVRVLMTVVMVVVMVVMRSPAVQRVGGGVGGSDFCNQALVLTLDSLWSLRRVQACLTVLLVMAYPGKRC
jgi:hypothetical protein